MSQQPQRPAQKSNPVVESILREARGARTTSEKLLPLLELLQEGEGEGGPLDEVKGLLEQILLSQRHLHLSLEDLHAKVDALGRRPRRSPSTGSLWSDAMSG